MTSDATTKSEGRIAHLVSELNATRALRLRYDIDDNGEEAQVAHDWARRIEEELTAIRPQTTADAVAALQLVGREFMEDRVGEELSLVEMFVLNLLDGVREFVLSQDGC
ncbi:hypothetical protein V5F77_24015 [Xanthobacter sp. DSM 24535]|uniref:hypothetical protein n=1 Tax=Roseixanthobacter psychrophilus TaxID=3119917 RepID=UPI0037291F51